MSIRLPVSAGVSAADIWSYPSRTLTQVKFPFWSAIISPTYGSLSVAGGATADVDIKPEAGETWWIMLRAYFDYELKLHVAFHFTDGTSVYPTYQDTTGGTYGKLRANLSTEAIITSSIYGKLRFINPQSAAFTAYYGYSGFKLSKPIYTPARTRTNPPPPWKRKPSSLPIPSVISELSKYIADIYDHSINDYRQAILLEENTVLARDPETNEPVELLTVFIYVDDFINNVLNPHRAGKLDLVKSGWKKYFDKWEEEGIKFR